MATLAEMRAHLEAHGYKLVTWRGFLEAEDRPEGLLERAMLLLPGLYGPHVVYDPSDDENGWLLVCDDVDGIAEATCQMINDGNILNQES
jgi:hypothetical protein